MRLFILSIYRNKKGQLPPIESSILLQPATVIAKRIRQRQVKAQRTPFQGIENVVWNIDDRLVDR